MTKRWLRTSDE